MKAIIHSKFEQTNVKLWKPNAFFNANMWISRITKKCYFSKNRRNLFFTIILFVHAPVFLPMHNSTFWVFYTIKQSNIKIALPLPCGQGQGNFECIDYFTIRLLTQFHGQGMGRFEKKLNTFDRSRATGNRYVYIYQIIQNIYGQTKTIFTRLFRIYMAKQRPWI